MFLKPLSEYIKQVVAEESNHLSFSQASSLAFAFGAKHVSVSGQHMVVNIDGSNYEFDFDIEYGVDKKAFFLTFRPKG
jgi:mRNA-degrading endonuclease HigB of HigAB toxin-antitoxin module